MSDKFRAPTKAKLPEDVKIPHPRTCMVTGCDEPPEVIMAVYTDGGRRKVGFPPHAHSFRAEGWIARCAHHYLTELYRSGNGVYQDLCDPGSYIPTHNNLERFRSDRLNAPKANQSPRLVEARANAMKAIGELVEAMPELKRPKLPEALAMGDWQDKRRPRVERLAEMDVRGAILMAFGGGQPNTCREVAFTLAAIRRDPYDVAPELLEAWACQSRRHKPLIAYRAEIATARGLERRRKRYKRNLVREATNEAFERLIGSRGINGHPKARCYDEALREAENWLKAALNYAQAEFEVRIIG